MNTPTTLAAYAAGLALVFGAALGVGSVVGPVGTASAEAGHGSGQDDGQDSGSHGSHGSTGGAGHVEQDSPAEAARLPGGLAVSQDGYTLQVDAAPRTAGQEQVLAFRVLGPEGAPVTSYVQQHERDLHLVVVRRDATGFQHLHPERDAQGRWSTPLVLAEPGTYKVFADVRPAGADEGLVLATDVTVPGTVQATVLPEEQRTATVDGYTVRLTGDLVAGTSSPLTFSVSRGGRPVTDLEPYLGAYGHLVALRTGDLAYLHVHPEDGPAGGPDVVFGADVPSPGTYRLFLDVQHDGAVRTAAFTLPATAAATTAPATTAPAATAGATGGGHGDGHGH